MADAAKATADGYVEEGKENRRAEQDYYVHDQTMWQLEEDSKAQDFGDTMHNLFDSIDIDEAYVSTYGWGYGSSESYDHGYDGGSDFVVI